MSSEILEFLEKNPTQIFTQKDLIQATGKSKGTISYIINKLNDKNKIDYIPGRGRTSAQIKHLDQTQTQTQTETETPSVTDQDDQKVSFHNFPDELIETEIIPETQTQTQTETETQDQSLDQTQTQINYNEQLLEDNKELLAALKKEQAKNLTLDYPEIVSVPYLTDKLTESQLSELAEILAHKLKGKLFTKEMLLEFFPSLDQVFNHIETSINPAAQTWNKQIKKHSKQASVTAIYSFTKECCLKNLQEGSN